MIDSKELKLPEYLYERLEMDKVLRLLSADCHGDLARDLAVHLPVIASEHDLNIALSEAREAKLSFDKNEKLPMSVYSDIAPDLKLLTVDGYVLSIEQLQRINQQLVLMQGLMQFFNVSRQESYPALFQHLRNIDWNEALGTIIGLVIDKDGEIRPNASPELMKLRSKMTSKLRELDGVFRSVVGKYRNAGLLSDIGETLRNGRRVLSVPSENKRKVRGILHDESATGRTSYIEPEETIQLNNDVIDLELEERKEIYRILRDLSEKLRVYVYQIMAWQTCIVHLDLTLAKGRLGLRMKAGKPNIQSEPTISIKEGYHPLLFLKNKQFGKKTVPFELTFREDNRILMISGPNAGGKSITMKAIGLMQLMVQSGLLVPCKETSTFGIFKQFFADIGDSQSLEDDLSTYSSRLVLAKDMLASADAQSLVLIDEFGSGTDPQIGGAIAEAILDQLHKQKAFCIVTSHYANLKIYAYKTPGILNGSMYFDRMHLKPTFELKVGTPGSSYAFEIADKIGLPKPVMVYVEKRLGKTDKAVDQMLIELQQEKRETEDHLKSLQSKQENLDKLIKSYQELQKDVDRQRKQMLLDSKRQSQELASKENKELEKAIREIRESQNLEQAKKMAEEARLKKAQISEESRKLDKQIAALDLSTASAQTGNVSPWQVGNQVRLRQTNGLGVIEQIAKNEAVVVVGGLRITARLQDLLPTDQKIEVARTSHQVDLAERNYRFDPELDIRGVVPGDAIRLVEHFVDDAFVNGSHKLRIVHGKGSGAMRNVVHSTLKQYKKSIRYSHPPHNEGGDGVTVVEMI